MHLINSTTKQPVNVGDVAHTFRGEPVIILGWAEPREPNSTGRIHVQSMDECKQHNSWYPSVCNMEWTGETNY